MSETTGFVGSVKGVFAKIYPVYKKIEEIITVIIRLIFKLRKFVMAAPVAYYAWMLAQKNLEDNGLTGRVINGDLRDRTLVPADHFHLVVSNPPYFRTGSGASGGTARMDETCSVEDLCQTAGRLTRTGGRFALVYRPERMAELFSALEKARLTPKRMQLLAYDRTKPPYAVLVESVKDGGPGLDILPNHYQIENEA